MMGPLVLLLCFIQGFGVQGAEWEIIIRTSDSEDAATDSDIYITLHGSRGSSAEIKLFHYYNPFQSNQMDSFIVTTEDIGEVCSLTIRSAGNYADHDWHLREIVVHGITQKEPSRHTFTCRCWLDKQHGLNRVIQADIPCSRQS